MSSGPHTLRDWMVVSALASTYWFSLIHEKLAKRIKAVKTLYFPLWIIGGRVFDHFQGKT